jgi:L-rhamnose mutarotase
VSEIIGLHRRLKPGLESEFDAALAAVQADVLAAIRAAGFTRWLIFRDGLDVFHTIECENYALGIAQLGGDPVGERWKNQVAAQLDLPSGDVPTSVPLVFEL